MVLPHNAVIGPPQYVIFVQIKRKNNFMYFRSYDMRGIDRLLHYVVEPLQCLCNRFCGIYSLLLKLGLQVLNAIYPTFSSLLLKFE